MSVAMVLGWIVVVWWVSALAARTLAVVGAMIHPRIRRATASRQDLPPVSIVIPVVREEYKVDVAIASAFAQDYPDFEVLVTSDVDGSPTIDIARKVADRFSHVPSRLILGNRRSTFNPKISNLAPAIRAARNDLIMVKDANVELAEDRLTELVRSLTQDTGMVCALTVGTDPASFFGQVGCAMTNAHAAPWMLLGDLLGGSIGFGKAMLLDRRDLQRVDGLTIMAESLGDDHVLAKTFSRVGLRTVFSAGVVRQALGPSTFRELWDRQLRWMVIRRTESPLAFLFEPLTAGALVSAAAAMAAPTIGLASWAMASWTWVFWLITDATVLLARGWGLSWWLPLAGLVRDLLIPALWVSAWFTRTVTWAGRTLRLARDARSEVAPERRPAVPVGD